MTRDHTSHGKWSEAGMPKKGWSCVGIEDLGEPSQLCEMCESVTIRYVHYMEHGQTTESLAVGCVCAEHMEEDYVRPKERERGLRSLAKRRKTWAERSWKRSAKGNDYINTEGYNLTVFPKNAGFGVVVTNRKNGATRSGNKEFASVEEARAGALTALVWAKTHLQSA